MFTKLIHLTDTHLVPPGQTLCALDPAARLAAAVEDINRLHGDAHAVVLTGDISYHGRHPAYELGCKILSKLRVPCHLLIGNHDDRTAFRSVFPDTPVDPEGFVQYVVNTPSGALVMLDTVDEANEGGCLCPARLGWLENQLRNLAARPIFVFMHHPPFAVGVDSLDASRMRDDGVLAELLLGHGQVRHLFYGHVHRPVSGSWHGIPTSSLPGTNHQVGLLLDRALDMIGTHERPAYGVVLIDEHSVIVHQKDFVDDSPRFVLTDPKSKQATDASALAAVPASLVGRA